MLNTILFDLDGTLLPMDLQKFLQLYFYHMGKHFEGWISPEKLRNDILTATDVMITTNDGRTNSDIFMDVLASLIDGDIEDYKNHFTKYYDSTFVNVKSSTYVSLEMIQAVQLLIEKGYEIAIATNPLFPMQANIHRIHWAGMKPEWFRHITSFEENKHAKPFPQFYQEVLDKIQKQPEECMMVGNDPFDDLPASKLGMKTYLITDCLLNEKNLPLDADYVGSYDDFLQFVKDLPQL